MADCDCIHDERHHCPATGACLWTNPNLGPCPCASTPPSTRAALEAVYSDLSRVQARKRGEAPVRLPPQLQVNGRYCSTSNDQPCTSCLHVSRAAMLTLQDGKVAKVECDQCAQELRTPW